MQRQSRKISVLASSAMVFCGLLGAAAIARADDGHKPNCSNRSLKGDYGVSVTGLSLPAPGVSLPLIGVVMAHYDGDGKFTQVDHIIFAGNPPAMDWTPGSGTYHVNPDCTGKASFTTITGSFVNTVFVVVKDGKEILAVVTAPFDGPPRTVSAVSVRVE